MRALKQVAISGIGVERRAIADQGGNGRSVFRARYPKDNRLFARPFRQADSSGSNPDFFAVVAGNCF